MRFRCLLASLLLAVTAIASAVTLNQVDTFQDGTTSSWLGGASPTNISTGGPMGAGDRYLQISSSNSHLATFNSAQWSGNYTASGVNRIEADLKNTGPNPLVVRLVLFSGNGDRWSSISSISLAPSSNWTHVAFTLQASNFQRTVGSGSFSDVMNTLDRLMFRHEPTISANGVTVTGQLGIDNVTALAATTTSLTELYTINTGIFGSGVLAGLNESDNSYLYIRQNPARSRLDPAVSVTFEATAASGAFASLRLQVETNTDGLPAADITQITELYNFQTGQWNIVDSRPASSTDQLVELTSVTPGAYVDSTTRKMRARVRFMDPGTLLTKNWGVSFDLVRWILTR